MAAALAAALLTACATVPPPAPTPAGGNLSGRMAVRVDASPGQPARSLSAAFELQGAPERGRFALSTPLGTMLAQARWSPGDVVLATSQGETPYPDLDTLTREMLGETVPVAALFDWLQGRPWPGAASVVNQPPAGPGFRQLGWSVDLARFADASIAAVREQAPAVSVRIKLDRAP
ncbi:MAG: outer membrane lipoprotein LolB [Piscinibacter sp.]|nr:outer membrane lipoprotein LolB [Piscinibacter sp.]